ncbi:MAG: Mini-ribonuclease 3 [Bacilli bacterium]
MKNALVMAYIGDAVYELYIRKYLVKNSDAKVNDLQTASLKYVSAVSQRKHFERLESANFLTSDEIEIYKWGRNAHGGKAKNADIVTYRIATGLEALIGSLYYAGNIKRVEQIMDFIVGD